MPDPIKRGSSRLRELRARIDQIHRDFAVKGGDGWSPADEVKRAVRKHNARPERTADGAPRSRPPDPRRLRSAGSTGSGHPGTGSAVSPILYRRDLPRSQPHAQPRVNPGRPVLLMDAVQGREVVHTARGKGYLITSPVADRDGYEGVSGRFLDELAASGSGLCGRMQGVCDPAGLSLEHILFMDLETTGLGNSPLFLIGTMVWAGDGFEVRQYLARDYAEEAAVISLFLDEMAEKKLLVTFNGKSFDWPYVRTRAIANGIPFELRPPHLDLVHVCRRIWKASLPDCKLQTLENHICRRGAREGDIPGAEIPDAYHDFVRTGNACQIVDVLKHNVLDLITMADIMARLPQL